MIASIVIPTYGRPQFLSDAVISLRNQGVPPDQYEIIIVDNKPSTANALLIRRLGQEWQLALSYIEEPNAGLHNARHTGARNARSHIIVYIDDDVTVSQGWLEAIVDTFDDPEVHLVGGRNLPRYEGEPPDWIDMFWIQSPDGARWCGYLSLLDFGDEPREIDPLFVWGLNFAIRKETLARLGGFNPDALPWALRRYRGDGETAVSREAKRLGLKAMYQPGALVHHAVPESRMTVEYFERRAYLQGISDSYTAIRSAGGLQVPEPPRRRLGLGLAWHRTKQLARQIMHRSRTSFPDPRAHIRDRVRRAYVAGYEFHQDEVRTDSQLLEWVLREDYWDCPTPVQRHFREH